MDSPRVESVGRSDRRSDRRSDGRYEGSFSKLNFCPRLFPDAHEACIMGRSVMNHKSSSDSGGSHTSEGPERKSEY